MMFTSITELADAIASGTYLAEEPDLPFENVIYEPVAELESAMIMKVCQDSISFYEEKQKQSFDFWLSENEYHRKVFQVDEDGHEPEMEDDIYTSPDNIFKIDLNSTLEISEYLELMKEGTSELNEPAKFEMTSLADLLDLFFLIPCGKENFPQDSQLLPVRSFLDHADHETIEHIKTLFLVINDKNRNGVQNDIEWSVERITKADLIWPGFKEEYEKELTQFGLTNTILPNDMAWFTDDCYNMMRRERLAVCTEDIRKLTHKPVLVTRVKPDSSQNFMNDEIELRHSIEGFMKALLNEDIKAEEILTKLADFKIPAPATRMQQIKHSFECRCLKSRLRERFNDLLWKSDSIPADQIKTFYEARINELAKHF